MAMTYGGIQYYPISVVLFDEIYMGLIEARFGMKGIAIAMKLLCKIYKENGYYLLWGEEQCALFTNKAGKDIDEEEMQGIVDILVDKGFFDKQSYEKQQVLTSIEIQKVWLEATKRRKRGDIASLPYILVKTEEEKSDKGDKDGKETECMQNPQNCIQDVADSTENADNSGQSIVEYSRAEESKELPPLTPPTGEDVGVWRRYSFVEFPGYAYNKNTHNLECLLLALDGLHINDPNDVKAILKLSDYGRLGNGVWKIIHATKWSIVNSKGKYLVGALNKARNQ
ncbi:DUF4373 domain-containing protein [Bacteroides timonensis]|uniref:DUF4373 domain-containing protein n=1 Tax=Bacteroides timonensis TaxID=1470345 RepID=UPI0005C70700|nr:DUF4373 domain-containing protein [Bacteroides timonensis]